MPGWNASALRGGAPASKRMYGAKAPPRRAEHFWPASIRFPKRDTGLLAGVSFGCECRAPGGGRSRLEQDAAAVQKHRPARQRPGSGRHLDPHRAEKDPWGGDGGMLIFLQKDGIIPGEFYRKYKLFAENLNKNYTNGRGRTML